MEAEAKQRLLRNLPSVDSLLAGAAAAQWLASYPRALVVEEIRAALEQLRRQLAGGGDVNGGAPRPEVLEAELAAQIAAQIAAEVGRRLADRVRPSLARVINATGVILHTNLGRAPLAAAALEAIAATAGGYTNLEYDLAAGRRGKRDVHVSRLLEKLLGSPAVVVNNNAAAIFLALHELAGGGEVIVSRGELIEIGDGFRIPEILARSGAKLREVGATNRTRVEDYRAAIGGETRLLLRVHPSNFRMVGFTERPALADLAKLARDKSLPLVEDLGSGSLFDFASLGVNDEPTVRESLAGGADLVTFSGDKLLGGPQAGIIAGRPDLVARLRRNPLFRALRADKLVYAALEATLREYVLERYDRIPVLRMARQSGEQLKTRAEKFAASLGADFPADVSLHAGESVLGGGSTPSQGLATWLVGIRPNDVALLDVEQRLRHNDPPVVARLEDNGLRFDLRTVADEQEDELRNALRQACQG
ncbi:MAG: L-seryl-tRNA(Sec) selenium transferase [Bryobacterales bacterium]